MSRYSPGDNIYVSFFSGGGAKAEVVSVGVCGDLWIRYADGGSGFIASDLAVTMVRPVHLDEYDIPR